MRTSFWWWCVGTYSVVALLACGDDTSDPAADAQQPEVQESDADVGQDVDPQPDVDVDVNADVDADVVPDALPDAMGDSDISGDTDVMGDTDVDPPTCPAAPARRIGEGAAASLAANAAACGQAPFAWLDNEGLGEVTRLGPRLSFPAALLEVALSQLDVVLPVSPTYNVVVHTMTYQTQDRGALIEATGLVALPTNRPADAGPLPILLALHGTSGFADGCGVANETEWRALIALFASLGWAVVSPDYLGLRTDEGETGFGHPYLVGQATALASIDQVRALYRRVEDIVPGTCLAPEVLIFGGSQGGHAALWVERLLPYYAAEFGALGTAATVPPADLVGQSTAALLTLRNSTANTLAFLSLMAEWYGLEDELSEVLRAPFDVSVPAALAADCSPGSELGLDDVTLQDVFTEEVLGAAAAGTLGDFGQWGCVLRANSLLETNIPRLGDDPPHYGVLFITGEDDELVDTPIERAAWEGLCTQGLPTSYVECVGSRHGETTFRAIGPLLDFFAARKNREVFVGATACEAPAAEVCELPAAP